MLRTCKDIIILFSELQPISKIKTNKILPLHLYIINKGCIQIKGCRDIYLLFPNSLFYFNIFLNCRISNIPVSLNLWIFSFLLLFTVSRFYSPVFYPISLIHNDQPASAMQAVLCGSFHLIRSMPCAHSLDNQSWLQVRSAG